MTFQQVLNLLVWQSLPFSKTLYFQQADPDCPAFKSALDITGYTLVAKLKGKAKAKAYELTLADPPTPGDYVLLLVWGDDEHTITITVEPGDTAIEVIEKIEAEIEALLVAHLKVCPVKCGGAGLYILGLWPGILFTLSIVSQPSDDLELDLLQEDAPLAVFSVASAVVGDKLEVTLSLTAKATSVLPVSDGPYDWSLVALQGVPEAAMLLARGYVIVSNSPAS